MVVINHRNLPLASIGLDALQTVRLGFSHPDHVFFAPREPSVAVFDKLRVALPSSFATLESPAAPEDSRHNLRECGFERSSEPPGSVMFDDP